MAPNITTTTDAALVLPVSLIGKIDVGRLLREIELLDNFLTQSTIREPGVQAKLPKTSRLLDEAISTNKLNVLVEADRQQFMKFLQTVYDKGPVLHMSFNADPSPRFTTQLVGWLRKEIHPQVLLQIGLQPNIGVGCMLRTPNHYLDLSLRQRFVKQRQRLVEHLQQEVQAGREAAK
jgi:hypothetical protein